MNQKKMAKLVGKLFDLNLLARFGYTFKLTFRKLLYKGKIGIYPTTPSPVPDRREK
jgi:hypothetical protein